MGDAEYDAVIGQERGGLYGVRERARARETFGDAGDVCDARQNAKGGPA